MDQAAVVPDQEHPGLPAMPVDKLRLFLMLVERLEQRRRFVFGHALDTDGVARAHEERGATGLGMHAGDRMLACAHRTVIESDRHRTALGAVLFAVKAVFRIAAACRMDARQTAQAVFHVAGQRVPGGVLAGKERVAALRRDDRAVERGRRRRRRQEAPVRMKILGKDRCFFVGLAADLDHMRMARNRRDIGVFAARAEHECESLEIFDRHVLIGKGDHAVGEPGSTDGVCGLGRQGRREVDPPDVRAAGRAAGFNLDHGECLRNTGA